LGGPEIIVPLPSPPAPSGGKIQPAQLISRSDPIYPPFARVQRIAGNVEVNFKISANGDVKDVVAKGPAVLTQAAVEAVRKWHYVPARLNGVSTETQATTVVAFRLN
jgi:protein TonB